MTGVRALLLCGGRSSRFGSNKLLATLDGGPLVVRSARNLMAGAGRALAVVPAGSGALAVALREAGCDVLESPDSARGLGASLAAGVRTLADADGWIVALGDMPFIRASTIAAVAERIARGALIAAPMRNGQRGHPVGFGAALKAELLALDGDEGARQVIGKHRDAMVGVAVDDEGITADVDVPADLERKGGGT